MSTQLIIVRSQRTYRKYEITWEIPNLKEVNTEAVAGGNCFIDKVEFNTCFTASNLPVKWSIELRNPKHSSDARFPRQPPCYGFEIILQWEFQNALGHKTTDECMGVQLRISKKDGEQVSTLFTTSRRKPLLQMKSHMIPLHQHDLTSNLPGDGQLTLQINLEQYEPPSFQVLPEIESLKEEGASKCLEDFSNLLRSGLHSDFCIKLEGGALLKVHKAILAGRSPVLGRMLESGMLECASGEMIIDDISSKTMDLVLQFIYSGQLDEKSITVDIVEEVAYAADKYDLPLIKEAVNRLLHTFCVVENAMNLWKTSKLLKLKTAEEQISSFVYKNIQGIAKINMNFEDK